MGGTCSTDVEIINAYLILVGNPERNILFGRSRRKSKDNIKTELKGTGYVCVCVCVHWIELSQDGVQGRIFVIS